MATSGYISVGYVLKLLHYDQATERIIYLEESKFLRICQRIFHDNKFGAQKKPKHSFVLVKGKSANGPDILFARFLLFLEAVDRKVGERTLYAFLKSL